MSITDKFQLTTENRSITPFSRHYVSEYLRYFRNDFDFGGYVLKRIYRKTPLLLLYSLFYILYSLYYFFIFDVLK